MKRALEATHDHEIGGGHSGVENTFKKIAARYWWPNYYNAVRCYVLTCTECQLHRHQWNSPSQPLGQHLPCGVFEELTIDFIGPLPIGQDGHRYIITAINCATRYTIMATTPDN